ncbi:venom metalloproteinase antarease-like TfasMP_A isoform X2 [Dermacentor albipictus]|uniref:venom metalloproteinase antarease-like TfasMP_A isoform X2 n=1 Tax=Dermacentor albipictus TaxID=60249 RepID=UPI0038FCE37E
MQRCMRWFIQISVLYGPIALGMPTLHMDNGVMVYPRVLDTRKDNSTKTALLGDGYSLSLTKASVFAEMVHLREVSEAGVTERYAPGAEYERYLYQDAKMKASLLLKPQAHGHYHIVGLLNFTHLIHPITNEEKAPSGEIPHKISRIRHSERRSDIITASTIEAFQDGPTELNEKSLPSSFNIETYIIQDNSHTNRMKAVNLDPMDTTATLVSQTNLLLQKLEPPGTIVVTGIEITHRATETYIVRTDDNRLQAEATASKLFDYAASIPRMQRSDVVIYITWLHMVGHGSGGGYIDIDGHTILGGACSKQKVLIIREEPGQFSAVQATAHEVAHSLGSNHDGAGISRGCPANENFLMYPYAFPPTTKEFSKCTKNAVARFLELDRAKCLFTDSSGHINIQSMKTY